MPFKRLAIAGSCPEPQARGREARQVGHRGEPEVLDMAAEERKRGRHVHHRSGDALNLGPLLQQAAPASGVHRAFGGGREQRDADCFVFAIHGKRRIGRSGVENFLEKVLATNTHTKTK